MKKKIASLLLFAAFIAGGLFATPIDGNLSGNVLASFNKRFDNASEVSWSRTNQYIKASFTLADQAMFAYFTHQGELIGTSKNMRSTQLPANLQHQLKKVPGQHWITELFEFSTVEQTTYYATVENADEKVYLQSDNNAWSIVKKIRKN